jgi:hypothetical protein
MENRARRPEKNEQAKESISKLYGNLMGAENAVGAA